MKKALIWVVLIKTIMVLLFIQYGWVRLGPDEAQYWTWSENLAPGYYSKPPGIAFQIALGTLFFGNTELGVRFGSVLLGIVMPFLIARLAQNSWAGIIWALSPLGWVGSFLAITDGGMIFFWTLACLIRSGWLLSLVIALGALFKWPIYLFWLFAPRWDIRLIALSLIGLLPALWWNAENDWATFRHVAATLQGGSGAVKAKGNLLEFLGSQVALLSPVFFVLMLMGARKKDFSTHTTFFSIALGALFSLFMKVQGNWAIFAYPTAPLLVVRGAGERKGWLVAGSALSVALVISAALFIPLKHNTGWDKLPSILQEAGYDPNKHYLVSDKYQTTSLISFYSPGQKVAHFLNLRHDRLNQFSFWPKTPEGEGFFVTFENDEPPLAPYFTSVKKLGPFPLTDKKQVTLYKVAGYNDLEPSTGTRY